MFLLDLVGSSVRRVLEPKQGATGVFGVFEFLRAF